MSAFTSTAGRFDGKLPGGATSDSLKGTFTGKHVLFYIERSNNSNAVIYEANKSGSGLDDAGT